MVTTIKISEELQKTLKERKLYGKESYEEVIWDLLEDSIEINEETKKDIIKAQQDYKLGKVKTLEQIKKFTSSY